MPIGIGKAIRGFGKALKSAKSGTVKIDPKYKDPMGKTKVEAQKVKAKYIKKGLKEPQFSITKKEIEMAQKSRAADKKLKKQLGAVVGAGGAAIGGVKLAAEKGPEPVKKFLKSEPKIVDGKLKLVDTRKKKNDKKNKK